jgi:hypothetical protein
MRDEGRGTSRETKLTLQGGGVGGLAPRGGGAGGLAPQGGGAGGPRP